MSSKRTVKKARTVTPLTLDVELDAKVSKAAATTKLSKQAVMRMSIERGLDILLSQLSGKSAA
jgi:predicted transcriptional regulator